jgi:hypothetical protein
MEPIADIAQEMPELSPRTLSTTSLHGFALSIESENSSSPCGSSREPQTIFVAFACTTTSSRPHVQSAGGRSETIENLEFPGSARARAAFEFQQRRRERQAAEDEQQREARVEVIIEVKTIVNAIAIARISAAKITK